MAEFFVMVSLALFAGLGFLVCRIGKLLGRALESLVTAIFEEVERRRILAEERRKEERLIEAHNRARDEIDAVVTHYVSQQEQAAMEVDRYPGPRRSG